MPDHYNYAAMLKVVEALRCHEAYSLARASNDWMGVLSECGWDHKENPTKFLHRQRRAALSTLDATPRWSVEDVARETYEAGPDDEVFSWFDQTDEWRGIVRVQARAAMRAMGVEDAE